MSTDYAHFYRMRITMEKLEKLTESEYSIFIRVLFGLSTPSPVPADLGSDPEFGNIDWVDPTLNDSQKDAIRFALASKEIALIHGPPGVCFFSLPFSPPCDSHHEGSPERTRPEKRTR